MDEAEKSESSSERFAVELDGNFRRPLVAYFYRRVGDRAEAEDLTQEVFLRVLQQSDTFDPTRARAYIFTAAANLLRDRARRALTRRTTAHTTVDDPTVLQNLELREEIGPERVLLAKETLRAVYAVRAYETELGF
jgi:RNA polymerase sigma-70 factor (ECF subfamily)